MKRQCYKRFILLVVLSTLLLKCTLAQDEKFKAIFIYNFIKKINWPEQVINYNVYVVGSSLLFKELESISLNRKVGNSPIIVYNVNSIDEVNDCQVIFISSDKTSLLPEVFEKAMDENILIISDKQNACTCGSGINFRNINGKLTYEISRSNIEKCKLQVSSDLTVLGIPVN